MTGLIVVRALENIHLWSEWVERYDQGPVPAFCPLPNVDPAEIALKNDAYNVDMNSPVGSVSLLMEIKN